MIDKGYSIYYAHHRWKYHTKIEEYELDLIRQYFPTATIFNPSEHLDVEGRSEEDIMKDCLDTVRKCDFFIFSSMDGVIGKGVYEELQEAVKNKKQILYIYNDTLITEGGAVKINTTPSHGDRTYAIVWPFRSLEGKWKI